MAELAPVVLFVYNRPEHTLRTVEALLQNRLAEKTDLIVYADASKPGDEEKVRRVKKFIHSINGFHTVQIFKRDENFGLAKSVIDGVTRVVSTYGKIIVVEDDIITSPHFLEFMNQALCFYADAEKIYSISGYNLPLDILKIPKHYSFDVYVNPRPHSWGWATWQDRWARADWQVTAYNEFINDKKSVKRFNAAGADLSKMLKMQMEGKIDSWAIRWCLTHFLDNALSIYPVHSFVNNAGLDGSGVHCEKGGGKKFIHQQLSDGKNFNFVEELQVNDEILQSFCKAYTPKINVFTAWHSAYKFYNNILKKL